MRRKRTARGLATPMSAQIGVGKGAPVGVLGKSAEALERLEKVDTLVVDKTGTLTEGKPQVTKVAPMSNTRRAGRTQQQSSFAESDVYFRESSSHPQLADMLVPTSWSASMSRNLLMSIDLSPKYG